MMLPFSGDIELIQKRCLRDASAYKHGTNEPRRGDCSHLAEAGQINSKINSMAIARSRMYLRRAMADPTVPRNKF